MLVLGHGFMEKMAFHRSLKNRKICRRRSVGWGEGTYKGRCEEVLGPSRQNFIRKVREEQKCQAFMGCMEYFH